MNTSWNTKRHDLPDQEPYAESRTSQRKKNHLKVVRLPTERETFVRGKNENDNDSSIDTQQRSPLVKRTVLTLLVLLLAACSTGKDIDQAQNQHHRQAAQPVLAQVSAAIRSMDCHVDEDSLQQALLSLVNDARARAQRCGSERYSSTTALISHSALQRAAKKHSENMANDDFFSHQDTDGLQVWNRVTAIGYSYATIAENIATGQDTTGQVHDGWLGSAGHCANLMSPDITHFGAACASHKNTDNQPYWTTVFGRERKTL